MQQFIFNMANMTFNKLALPERVGRPRQYSVTGVSSWLVISCCCRVCYQFNYTSHNVSSWSVFSFKAMRRLSISLSWRRSSRGLVKGIKLLLLDTEYEKAWWINVTEIDISTTCFLSNNCTFIPNSTDHNISPGIQSSVLLSLNTLGIVKGDVTKGSSWGCTMNQNHNMI